VGWVPADLQEKSQRYFCLYRADFTLHGGSVLGFAVLLWVFEVKGSGLYCAV
jgi:hypothetical protein